MWNKSIKTQERLHATTNVHIFNFLLICLQIDREARVKEAISKLEKETRDRQNEEAQKAREIEDLKKEKKEREKAEREAMEEVKR